MNCAFVWKQNTEWPTSCVVAAHCLRIYMIFSINSVMVFFIFFLFRCVCWCRSLVIIVIALAHVMLIGFFFHTFLSYWFQRCIQYTRTALLMISAVAQQCIAWTSGRWLARVQFQYIAGRLLIEGVNRLSINLSTFFSWNHGHCVS